MLVFVGDVVAVIDLVATPVGVFKAEAEALFDTDTDAVAELLTKEERDAKAL